MHGGMRILAALLITASLCAAESATVQPPALTPAAQKALDDARTAAGKAHDAYLQAVKKEQDRVVALLQREMERETKKGNLNGALAIKAKIEEVQNGLLASQAEASGDLLGDAVAPAKPGLAALMCDGSLPLAKGEETPGAPDAVAKLLATGMCATIAKGDKTRYNLGLQDGGTVVANTGGSEHNNAELWKDLLAAGFRRIEGGDNAWFVLEAKAGTRFVAYDPPMAGLPLRLWARRIERPR